MKRKRAIIPATAAKRDFIPAGATIAEVEEKAAKCEKQAAQELEPRATELREEAKVYRAWVKELRAGHWTA
jgi:hypothetical protein